MPMDLLLRTTGTGRWLAALACLCLSLPGHASALRVAQLSGELLVPAAESIAPPSSEQPAPENNPELEPRPLNLVTPSYPSRAQRLEQDGRVVVCFTVDESGAVKEPVIVSSTDTLFNEPVLDAIAASRFQPAHNEGEAVKSTACRTFRFVARGSE